MGLSWGLGWSAIKYQQHCTDLKRSSITAMWMCDSTDILEFSKTKVLRCSSDWGTFRLEWKDASAPTFEKQFLGTATAYDLSASSWARWKYQQGARGTLSPALRNSEMYRWPERNSPRAGAWKALNSNFSPEVAGLLLAITTGDKSRLSIQLKRAFSRAGLAHLLAVSGYHVGLVGLISLWLLRRKKLLIRLMGLLSLFFVWEFIGFCGSPDSAIRAGLMLTLYGGFRLIYRSVSGMHILCLSAWSMLLMEPMRAHQLGTQLSFVAVASILLTLEFITQQTSASKVATSLAIPISAQAGTSFITWPIFGLFPVHFLLFNLLASPIMVALGFILATWFVLQHTGQTFLILDKLTEAIQYTVQTIISCFDGENQRHWALDVSQLPRSFGGLVSGLFFFGLGIELTRMRTMRAPFALVSCIFIGVVPWIWFMRQPVMTFAMRNGPYAVFETGGQALIWNEKDELAVLQRTAWDNQEPEAITLLKPKTYWCSDDGAWLIRTRESKTMGFIKNRPFSMSQMGDSSVSLAFGADSGQATAWGDPVHIRRYSFNSDEVSW